MGRLLLAVALSALLLASCSPSNGPATDNQAAATPEASPATSLAELETPPATKGEEAMVFTLESPAFADQEAVPRRYTCDGDDLSPPLQWSDPPGTTESFVLICDDPDAPVGTWVHWVVYNIPASVRELPEGIRADRDLPAGSAHGRNSWRRNDYGGPCPPGGTHRYFFRLYALDVRLSLNAGATKDQVLRAMEGHILAQAEVMGTYRR